MRRSIDLRTWSSTPSDARRADGQSICERDRQCSAATFTDRRPAIPTPKSVGDHARGSKYLRNLAPSKASTAIADQ